MIKKREKEKRKEKRKNFNLLTASYLGLVNNKKKEREKNITLTDFIIESPTQE